MKIRRLRSPLSSRRELTSQEHQLWTEVTKRVVRADSAARILKRPLVLKNQIHANLLEAQPAKFEPSVQWAPTVSNPGASIDRKTLRKLRRGVRQYDEALDLHGMTQREAHQRLKDFLIRSQTQGSQLVLVITGRGEGQAAHDSVTGKGILRRNVPEWLRSFRDLVSGFEEAPQRLGGRGALFVRLRRTSAG